MAPPCPDLGNQRFGQYESAAVGNAAISGAIVRLTSMRAKELAKRSAIQEAAGQYATGAHASAITVPHIARTGSTPGAVGRARRAAGTASHMPANTASTDVTIIAAVIIDRRITVIQRPTKGYRIASAGDSVTCRYVRKSRAEIGFDAS